MNEDLRISNNHQDKTLKLIILLLSLIVIVAIVKVNYFSPFKERRVGDNIIINALPKSASEYIAKSLADGLGYEQLKLSAGYIPVDQVQEKLISIFFSTKNVLSKQHLDSSNLNIRYIKKYTDRLVVHVRDPRQAMLSWTHHVDRISYDMRMRGEPHPPANYTDMELDEQIDWNIDNTLPSFVAWIQGWVNAKEREDTLPDGLNIVFTTYDDFKENSIAMYEKILSFYEIDSDKFIYVEPVKSLKVNFRTGELDEWRRELSASQKARVAKIVPQDLLSRFGWTR